MTFWILKEVQNSEGFPLYKGKGAKLERALINFMLDEQGKTGYTGM